MIDEFKTLKSSSKGLFKDKGSKFFAYAFPIHNEGDVRFYLENVKTDHPKARHACYAYKIGIDETNFRANDDGEPPGSAGKPILNTITSFDLTDTFVVVIRYFGGTLLGVSGLINAYKEAAKDALSLAEIETKTINSFVKISYDFDQTNAVMQMVRKLELTVKEQTFDNRCGIILDVRNSYIDKIKEAMKEYWSLEIEVL